MTGRPRWGVAALPAAILAASALWAATLPSLPEPPRRPAALGGAPAEQAPALPPYQGRLDRLAEVLGTLTYLRDLCGQGDGAQWRSRMDALLAAEGTTAARRDRLAGSFNRGFLGYQPAHRRCTPAAAAVIDRALHEGTALGSGMSATSGEAAMDGGEATGSHGNTVKISPQPERSR